MDRTKWELMLRDIAENGIFPAHDSWQHLWDTNFSFQITTGADTHAKLLILKKHLDRASHVVDEMIEEFGG